MLYILRGVKLRARESGVSPGAEGDKGGGGEGLLPRD